MMQYASSLDPNLDGSYNPLRYYADILNYVFNALFVAELGVRSPSSASGSLFVFVYFFLGAAALLPSLSVFFCFLGS